jgi:hypothetical protein
MVADQERRATRVTLADTPAIPVLFVTRLASILLSKPAECLDEPVPGNWDGENRKNSCPGVTREVKDGLPDSNRRR